MHYSTGRLVPKKYLSLNFYDNRNLKISKSKKSEQYFRDTIEIFIRSSMNTLLATLKVTDARRDVTLAGGLYHTFPWRHLPPPPGMILLILCSPPKYCTLPSSTHCLCFSVKCGWVGGCACGVRLWRFLLFSWGCFLQGVRGGGRGGQ